MTQTSVYGSDAQTASRYEAVLRLFRSLRTKQGCNDLVSLLPDSLRPLVEFDHLSLYLTNQKTNKSAWFVSDNSSPSMLTRALAPPPEEAVSSWVFENHRVVSLPSHDGQDGPHLNGFVWNNSYGSSVTLPMTSGRWNCGTLTFATKRSDAYSGEHIQLMEAIAGQLANAIVLADWERWCDRVELILGVNNTLVSKLELQDLLRSISASVRRTLACDFVGVAVFDEESKELRSYVIDFPDTRGYIKEGIAMPLDGTLLGQVFKSGQAFAGAMSDLPIDETTAKGRAEGFQFGCCYPLISRDRKLGVLSVARRGGTAFCPDDVELLGQVTQQIAIALDNAISYRQISQLKDKLAQEKVYLENEIRTELKFDEIVGHSPSLVRVLKQVETVAPTDSTVLIFGETGTGKELIARAIHNLSSRRGRTFVKLNCAAIPTGLLESELFGHEKGAFTGAVAQRIGRFELANHGTIFLDEISEIPLELQPKLLRVLQEREFERLGSSHTLRSDARLIAASNRNLAEMVEKQTFRADLFYRLNIFPIQTPALRERTEDIPLLVRHFVHQFSRSMNKQIETIPAETMQALTNYSWPGNIRELQNLIERAMILSSGSVLRVPLQDLKARPAQTVENNKHQTLEEAEKAHILSVLKDTKWVLSGPQGAASRLGMNRSTLRFRMGKLGIVRPGTE